MTIQERIRFIRKEVLKLNQADFAQKIKISRSNLGNIETGSVNLTDRIVYQICQTFDINEEWLRTGNGEMYAENDESIVRELIEKYHMTENQQRIMYAFLAMDDEKRERVATAFFDFIDSMRQQESKQSDADIEAELDAYRQELKAEAEARVSSPSAAGNGSSKRGA